MIQAAAAVYFLFLFAIWTSRHWTNVIMKITHLGFGLALGFQALQEFGYIFQIQ